ncbi:hypothetical protein BDM02DRAFT_3115968 [Thelephora ganbajun]|uniref:Uncharacterized protein n=1 Tax=Thelephora ganbajun TaxID=370292 RepID=A0ACB6ZEQ2_THEGA|nr:hypothetical protein BDM02DRAFT_3115968 [Thelephora ganbajun]
MREYMILQHFGTCPSRPHTEDINQGCKNDYAQTRQCRTAERERWIELKRETRTKWIGMGDKQGIPRSKNGGGRPYHESSLAMKDSSHLRSVGANSPCRGIPDKRR